MNGTKTDPYMWRRFEVPKSGWNGGKFWRIRLVAATRHGNGNVRTVSVQTHWGILGKKGRNQLSVVMGERLAHSKHSTKISEKLGHRKNYVEVVDDQADPSGVPAADSLGIKTNKTIREHIDNAAGHLDEFWKAFQGEGDVPMERIMFAIDSIKAAQDAYKEAETGQVGQVGAISGQSGSVVPKKPKNSCGVW